MPVYPEIMTKMRQDADKYIWESLSNVEHLGEIRMNAMSRFLSDFEAGCQQKGALCISVFAFAAVSDSEFDLAPGPHYLFSTATMWMERSPRINGELCRVATEVRVFPVCILRRRGLETWRIR